MSHQIDYYFTTISPYTYLADDRLERIGAAQDATIRYKPVDLMKVFSASGGVPLPQRPKARQEYRLMELERARKKTGLPLNLQPAFHPTNAAPSCYAIIAAERDGSGDTGLLCRLLLSACFAEEKNIAEDEVIRDCLSRAGFDPALADSGLFTGAQVFERNTEEAIEAGVFGAPFYIVDGAQRFWGHDRLDDLQAHLDGKI